MPCSACFVLGVRADPRRLIMSRSNSMPALVFMLISLAGCGAAAPVASIAEKSTGSLPHRESRAATERDRPASPSGAPAQYAPLPPSVSASGEYRSGTLTAGRLDDHAKFDDCTAYLS